MRGTSFSETAVMISNGTCLARKLATSYLTTMSSPSYYIYRPPKSALGAFLWRRRMWFEATFALSMLEPWEKVLVGAL
jgi:hypothetical protein